MRETQNTEQTHTRVGSSSVANSPAVTTASRSGPIRPLVLRTICGWCGVHLSGPRVGGFVSHGICPRCASAVEALDREQRAAR